MSYPSPQSDWQSVSYEHHTPPYHYGPQAPMPPYGYGYPSPPSAKSNNGVLIAVIVSIAVVVVGIIVYIVPLLFVTQMSSGVDEMISETTGGADPGPGAPAGATGGVPRRRRSTARNAA